jgi:hypothetical protein
VTSPLPFVKIVATTSALAPGTILLHSVEMRLRPLPQRRTAKPLDPTPPALLARTPVGRRALLRSGLLHQAAAAISDPALPAIRRRAALWSIVDVGTVPAGYALLTRHVCADVLHRIERLSAGSAGPGTAATSLSLRGASLTALSVLSSVPAVRADLAALQWALPASFGHGTSTGGTSTAEQTGLGGGRPAERQSHPNRDIGTWAASTSAIDQTRASSSAGGVTRTGFCDDGSALPWASPADLGSAGAAGDTGSAVLGASGGGSAVYGSAVTGVGSATGDGSRAIGAEPSGAAPGAPAAALSLARLTSGPSRPILPKDARALLTVTMPRHRELLAELPPVQLRLRTDPASSSADGDASAAPAATAAADASGSKQRRQQQQQDGGGGADDTDDDEEDTKQLGGVRRESAADHVLRAFERAGIAPPLWCLGMSGAVGERRGGFTHGALLPVVDVTGRAAEKTTADVIEAVTALSLRFSQADGEAALQRLAKSNPESLRSPVVFRVAHHLMAELDMGLTARRYLHSWLDGVPMTDDAWDE